MEDMNQEELLSAYLDDELSPEQRARVDAMLASDAEARATLEELRTISDALRALPMLRVGEDLSQRVLRRAERAMLEQKQPAEAAAPHDALQQALTTAAASNPPQLQAAVKQIAVTQSAVAPEYSPSSPWRRVLWPLLAVAAALLISVVNKQQQQPNNVALAPLDQEHQAASRAAEEPKVSDFHEHTAPDDRVAGDSASVAELRSAKDADEPVAGIAPQPAAERSEMQLAEKQRRSLAGPADAAPAGAAIPGAPARLEEQTDKALALPRGANSFEAQPGFGKAADESPSNGVVEAQREQKQFANQDRLARQKRFAADGAGQDRAAAESELALNQQRALVNESLLASQADARLQNEPAPQFVVELVLTDEALQNKAFESLLARQNIQLESAVAQLGDQQPVESKGQLQQDAVAQDKRPQPVEPKSEEPAKPGPSQPVAGKAALPGPPQKEIAAAGEKRDAQAQQDPRASGGGATAPAVPGAALGAAAPPEDLEFVYVVATPQQVQAALKDLRGEGNSYLAVNVNAEPPVAGSYRQLAKAERGAQQIEGTAEDADANLGQQTRPSALAEAESTPTSKPTLEAKPTINGKKSPAPAEAAPAADDSPAENSLAEKEAAQELKTAGGQKQAGAASKLRSDEDADHAGEAGSATAERKNAGAASGRALAGRAVRLDVTPAQRENWWAWQQAEGLEKEGEALDDSEQLAGRNRAQQPASQPAPEEKAARDFPAPPSEKSKDTPLANAIPAVPPAAEPAATSAAETAVTGERAKGAEADVKKTAEPLSGALASRAATGSSAKLKANAGAPAADPTAPEQELVRVLFVIRGVPLNANAAAPPAVRSKSVAPAASTPAAKPAEASPAAPE